MVERSDDRETTFVVDGHYFKKQAKDAVSELFAPVRGAVVAFEKVTRPSARKAKGKT